MEAGHVKSARRKGREQRFFEVHVENTPHGTKEFRAVHTLPQRMRGWTLGDGHSSFLSRHQKKKILFFLYNHPVEMTKTTRRLT